MDRGGMLGLMEGGRSEGGQRWRMATQGVYSANGRSPSLYEVVLQSLKPEGARSRGKRGERLYCAGLIPCSMPVPLTDEASRAWTSFFVTPPTW